MIVQTESRRTVALYWIRRDVPGLTEEELDASAFRALGCATEYRTMRWLQSYWDREAGTLTCVYEAESKEQIVEHARRARIPCDDVREVRAVSPQDYIGGPAT